MRVSIRTTVVAAVAALGMATAVATISTPAEAQFHGGGDFTAAASMAAAFTAEAGAAAGVAAAGVTGAPVGAGGAAVGIAAGAGAADGAGVGIRAGRSPRRPCLSESRSLRGRPMATVRVAGSGGASGPAADTILADGLSTFATDRPPAVSSDDIGPD